MTNLLARIRHWFCHRPDQQFIDAQRIARQATRDFKHRQRLRGSWFRLF